MDGRRKIVVLTGAGISAESGIPTFRSGVGSLWEEYDVGEVCTASAYKENPELIHGFYNMLRCKYKDACPNEAHLLVAGLEKYFDVSVVTQNVDDLHEKAGSTDVLHLHGELMKCRDCGNTKLIYDIPQDSDGNYDTHKGMEVDGHKVRPHIVLFGEDVPNMPKAISTVKKADILIIIGTSMKVYPAAGLIDHVKYATDVYYIDQSPSLDIEAYPYVNVVCGKATDGMRKMTELLTKNK